MEFLRSRRKLKGFLPPKQISNANNREREEREVRKSSSNITTVIHFVFLSVSVCGEVEEMCSSTHNHSSSFVAAAVCVSGAGSESRFIFYSRRWGEGGRCVCVRSRSNLSVPKQKEP